MGEIKLESGDTGGFTDVAVDPSGQQIAFVRDLPDANGDLTIPQLFVAPSTPANATQITSLDASVIAHPSWSPDGKKIVFSAPAPTALLSRLTRIPTRPKRASPKISGLSTLTAAI